MNELTVKQLKEMKGVIFATGTGTYPEICNHEIRWVAKRGDTYHDWTIYYGYTQMSKEEVARIGDKCFTESVIRRLVPCTDEAFALYRL